MGKCGIAALAVAAFALSFSGMHGSALAAPKGTAAPASSGSHAAAASEVSSQARRRPRTRITVYPRGYEYAPLVGPRTFGDSPYPRPYPYDWPGPYAKRDCVGWLATELRPSGPVVVPRRRCVWVPG